MSEEKGPQPQAGDSLERGGIRYRYQARTDVGRVRDNNEDCLILSPEIGLFGVCDGLGGHAAGEVASAIASATFCQCVGELKDPPQETLRKSIEDSNQRILDDQREHPERQGMGTTLTSFWLAEETGSQGWVGHVGDSRLYRFRNDELSQVTRDHSPVFRLYEQGALTKEQMHCHPRKNLLERSLGVAPGIDSEVFSLPFKAGDTFLLCTDGLSDRLLDQEIEAILTQHPIHEAADQLVAEANRKGGMDNITLVLLEIIGVSNS